MMIIEVRNDSDFKKNKSRSTKWLFYTKYTDHLE